MFENNIVYKRLMKRKSLQDELKIAQEKGDIWKINQLEAKYYEFNSKYYPSKKGDK